MTLSKVPAGFSPRYDPSSPTLAALPRCLGSEEEHEGAEQVPMFPSGFHAVGLHALAFPHPLDQPCLPYPSDHRLLPNDRERPKIAMNLPPLNILPHLR
jgi:hypothetical protein